MSQASTEVSLSSDTEVGARDLRGDNADPGVQDTLGEQGVGVGDGGANIAGGDNANEDLLRRHDYFMTCDNLASVTLVPAELAPEPAGRHTADDTPDVRITAEASECHGDALSTSQTACGPTGARGGRAREVWEAAPRAGERGGGRAPEASEGKWEVQFVGRQSGETCGGDRLGLCNTGSDECNNIWTQSKCRRPTSMPVCLLSVDVPGLDAAPSDPSSPEEFFDAPDELFPGAEGLSGSRTRENCEDFDDFKDALDTQPKDFLEKEKYIGTREIVTNSVIDRKRSAFVLNEVNTHCESCNSKTDSESDAETDAFGVQGRLQDSTGGEVSGLRAPTTRAELEECHFDCHQPPATCVSQNNNLIDTSAKNVTYSNDCTTRLTAGDTCAAASPNTDTSIKEHHESPAWKQLDRFQSSSDETGRNSQTSASVDSASECLANTTSMDENNTISKKYLTIDRKSPSVKGMEEPATTRPGRLPKAVFLESQKEKSEPFFGNLKPSGFRLRDKFVQFHERPESSLNEETRKIVKMLENDKACRVPRFNIGLQDRLQTLMQRTECKRPNYKRPKFCSTLVKTIVKKTTDRIESHTDSFEDFIRQRKEPVQTNHMNQTVGSFDDNKENLRISENGDIIQENQDVTVSVTSNSTEQNEIFPINHTRMTFSGRTWSPNRQAPDKNNSKNAELSSTIQQTNSTSANEVISHPPLNTITQYKNDRLVNSDHKSTDRHHPTLQGLDVHVHSGAKQRSQGGEPMDIHSEKELEYYKRSVVFEQRTIGARDGGNKPTLTTEMVSGTKTDQIETFHSDFVCEITDRNVHSGYVNETESYIQPEGLSETGDVKRYSNTLGMDGTVTNCTGVDIKNKTINSNHQSANGHAYTTWVDERSGAETVINNTTDDSILPKQKSTKGEVESALTSESETEPSSLKKIGTRGAEGTDHQNQPTVAERQYNTILDSSIPVRPSTLDIPPTTGLQTHTDILAPPCPLSLPDSSNSPADLYIKTNPPSSTGQPTMDKIANPANCQPSYDNYKRDSLAHEAGHIKPKPKPSSKISQQSDSRQSIDLKQHIASLNKVSSKLMNKVKDRRSEQPDYRASLSTTLKVALTQAVAPSPAGIERPGLKKGKSKVEQKRRRPKTKKQDPQTETPSARVSPELQSESSSSVISPEPPGFTYDEISQEIGGMTSPVDSTTGYELDTLSPSSEEPVTLGSFSSDELESPSPPESPTPEVPVVTGTKTCSALPVDSTIPRKAAAKTGSVIPMAKMYEPEILNLDKQIIIPKNTESELRTPVPNATKSSLLVSDPTRPAVKTTPSIGGRAVVTDHKPISSDTYTSPASPASERVPENSTDSPAWQRRKTFMTYESESSVKEDPQKRWNEAAILQLKTKNMVLRHCTNSIFPLPLTRGRRDTARKLWTQAAKPAVVKEPPKPAVVQPKLTQGEESPHGKRRSSLLGERRDSSHKVRRKQSNGKKPLEDLTVHLISKSNADNQRPPCSKQSSFEDLPPLPPCSEQNGPRQSLPHSRRESREKNLRSRQGSVAEFYKGSRRSSRERRSSSRLNSRRGSVDRTHVGSRRGTKASFTENLLRKCLEVALDKCELEEMEVTDEVPREKGPRYHDSLDKSLSRAVVRNNIEKVRELLEHGANPNISTGHVPALLRAARDGALYVVQALLRAGADVDARSEQGNSALHEAARVGHNEVVICLVYSNAHVDAINRNGVTPLQTALSYGQVEVVQTLIRFNADVYLKNKVGESALTIAEHLGYVGLTGSPAELRRSSGPGTCAPVVQMEVPVSVQLILGLEEGCPLTVENCLSQGASCNTLVPLALHWPAYATVLHRAAHHGDDLIARLLLQSGADVNARDVVGNTPLHAAAQAGHNRVVKLLLAHGADLEATSRSGMTPLHRAASKGKELTCNLLMRRGANTQAEDSEGRTPADWATRRGFKSVARKLGHRRRSSSGLMEEQQHKAYIKYLDELYKATQLESSRASPSPEPAPA